MLSTEVIYLKKVGEKRAQLLNKELNIFTFSDLLEYCPFRYEDRSEVSKIDDIDLMIQSQVLLKGRITKLQMISGRRQFLKATFTDGTGFITLSWFRSFEWVSQKVKPNKEYAIWGKMTEYNNVYQIVHPEIQELEIFNSQKHGLVGIYHSTEMLKKSGLDSRGIQTLQKLAFEKVQDAITETLPQNIILKYKLLNRKEAIEQVHFPENQKRLDQALKRLKFEELFYMQMEILQHREERIPQFESFYFKNTELLKKFYHEHLGFKLTNAQKRVIHEIYQDLASAKQMNRLLQGDVGSGKTIVAFIVMLIAIAEKTQCALMAPTEILAEQHYATLLSLAKKMGLQVAKLTGSTLKRERRVLLEELRRGFINIIVGTHALVEEPVIFDRLGLCVIDEQHRFGVAQRGKLWQKQQKPYPHVLIMTATPIPRTLAMTFYGDLDVSIIDQLPPGRKPIQTYLKYESNRLAVWGFLKKQIAAGRQAYIVYPLVEESEHFDYKDVTQGYENIQRAFPKMPISIVHGRMNGKEKDYEMERFSKGETKIMVATTVIEVGINIPNANVMLIENAERFGLSQLHQLRGRVGRSTHQSYCFLMSDYKISREGKTRLHTMVETTDGFKIADADLKLRGPGNLLGKEQSGLVTLKFADLSKDHNILELARGAAQAILSKDTNLENPANKLLKQQLHQKKLREKGVSWLRIS